MTRRIPILILAAAMFAPTPAARAEEDGPQKAVISAATSFSVGYGVWLMEKRCNSLDAGKRKHFDEVVADVLQRLQAATDPRIFNATVGAGRDVANDPANSDCKEFAGKGMADFGLTMAEEAQAALVALPEGYHLTLKD